MFMIALVLLPVLLVTAGWLLAVLPVPAAWLALLPVAFAALVGFDLWRNRRDWLGPLPLLLLAVLPLAALACGAAAAAEDVVTAGDAFRAIRGPLEWVLGGAAGLVAGWGLLVLRRVTGLSIDESYRTALHQALERGIHAGLDAAQGLADRSGIEVRSYVLAEAVRYVRAYAAAPVAHFKLDDAALADLARSHLARRLSGALSPAGT